MSTKIKLLKDFSFVDPSTSNSKIDGKKGAEVTVSNDCAAHYIATGRAEAIEKKTKK